jgi:hypothetical protein
MNNPSDGEKEDRRRRDQLLLQFLVEHAWSTLIGDGTTSDSINPDAKGRGRRASR